MANETSHESTPMSRKIASILAGAALLIITGCQSISAPGIDDDEAAASFDGTGGTLGSGYGTPAPNQADSIVTSTASDTTGRSGGTLGSGY
jgi:hypothetical protein